MSIDKFVVSLDPVTEGNELLVKNVDGEYKNKDVDALVVYLLDPNADALNRAYNEGEKKASDLMKSWRGRARSQSDTYEFAITAQSNEGSGKDIQLKLSDRLNVYYDRIVKQTPTLGNPNIVVPGIDLFARLNEKSGHVIFFYRGLQMLL